MVLRHQVLALILRFGLHEILYHQEALLCSSIFYDQFLTEEGIYVEILKYSLFVW